jgi:hypothetical protein
MSSQARDPHHPAAGHMTAGLPLELTHVQMNAAYDNGQAMSFAGVVPWLTRYRDAWWVVYEGGWLRIIDREAAESLDQRAAQITDQEVETARGAAIRAALIGTDAEPPPGG